MIMCFTHLLEENLIAVLIAFVLLLVYSVVQNIIEQPDVISAVGVAA